VSEAEKQHLNGHPPFVNDMAVFQRLGASDFDQAEAERHLLKDLAQKEYEYVNGGATRKKELKNDQAMAIKKTVNKRSVKRATKTA
jgi:hypothetical protein